MPKHYNFIDALRPAVANVSGMFYEDIIAKGRKAEKVKWRYLIVALVYEYDKTTQREISDGIGYNRSTVSYAITCVSERKEWAHDYNRLKEAVNEEINKQIHK
ncbi:MAG: hypothetical protein KBS70_02940 [Bacteroidales bacterium]|nr:hypothetical protein [Candidatus Colicola equi]